MFLSFSDKESLLDVPNTNGEESLENNGIETFQPCSSAAAPTLEGLPEEPQQSILQESAHNTTNSSVLNSTHSPALAGTSPNGILQSVLFYQQVSKA